MHEALAVQEQVCCTMSAASTVEVMVNTCFGGFGLSEAAMNEYHRRCLSKAREGGEENSLEYGISRHDPVMVQIVREMGLLASDRYAKVCLEMIPAQYVHHYSIREYDGMESVKVHRNAYKVEAARAILRDRMLSKVDKLTRLAAVLNAEESPLLGGVGCD